MSDKLLAILAVFAASYLSTYLVKNGEIYQHGLNVEEGIKLCEENLPRNQECTFMIIQVEQADESQ